MPRSIPGHYSSSATYDKFILNLYAINSQGEKIAMRKDLNDAPRWYYNDTGKLVSLIEYEVNLRKMERTLTPGDASIIRAGFVGILNYSIFGWIEGTEKEPVQCTVETFEQWPIFTTRTRVKEFKGIVPLFVASYCEVHLPASYVSGIYSTAMLWRYLQTLCMSRENKRAFTMEELPGLMNKACGIDLTRIYQKWQLPVE